MTIPTSEDIARTLTAVEAAVSRRAVAGTLIPDDTPCETVNTLDGHIAFITASDLHAVFADRPDWAYPAWGLHDFYDMEALCRLIPDLLAHGGVRRMGAAGRRRRERLRIGRQHEQLSRSGSSA